MDVTVSQFFLSSGAEISKISMRGSICPVGIGSVSPPARQVIFLLPLSEGLHVHEAGQRGLVPPAAPLKTNQITMRLDKCRGGQDNSILKEKLFC